MQRRTIFPAFFLSLLLIFSTLTLAPVASASGINDFTDSSVWNFYRAYWSTYGPWGYNATHAYVQASNYNWHGLIFWSKNAYNVSGVTLQVDAGTTNGATYDDNQVNILLTGDSPSTYTGSYSESLFHDGLRLVIVAARGSSGGVNATLVRRSSGVDTVLGNIQLSSYTGKLRFTISSNGAVTAEAYDGVWKTVGTTTISISATYYILLNAFTEYNDAPTYMANFVATGLTEGEGGVSDELYEWISWYSANVDWDSSVYTAYMGLQYGATSLTDVVSKVNALTDPKEVLYWAAALKKYNVESQLEAKIKWALDNMPMLSNGLPQTGSDHFLVYARGVLYAGLYYSNKWNYATSRWNVYTAYNSFKSAVTAAGKPVLWVYADGSTYCINYGPRFYDEAAQTLDVYLIFYDLGVTAALNDAVGVWNWINSNLWSGTYYEYAVNWDTYECEAGGFYQIALKLWARYPDMQYTSRLLTDINTRLLGNRWSSPQWTNYAVAHAAGYTEVRLQNTIMAWSSLLGVYNEMDSTAQANVQALIGGYTAAPQPAWYYLTYNSGLYDAENYGWRWSNTGAIDGNATAAAANLVFMLGMKPGTAALAIPLEEYQYEYTLSMFDKDLFQVDAEARTVKLAIYKPGTVTFIFGNTPVTGTFSSQGVYTVQFASDWNSISSVTRVGNLPTNRVYLGAVAAGEPTPTPTSDSGAPADFSGLLGLVALLGVLIAFLGVATSLQKKL